jgi:hypothetical protein
MAVFDRSTLIAGMQRAWAFGERFALAWSLSGGAVRVLFLERDAYLAVRRADPSSWNVPLHRSAAALAALRSDHHGAATVVQVTCAGTLPVRQSAHIDALVGRYAVTLSAPRPVLLFDLVGFTTLTPTAQLLRLAALERALSEAEGALVAHDLPLELRRTTTVDGFFVWDESATTDIDGRMLALLLLTVAMFGRQGRDRQFDTDALKATAGIGRYWHLHRIEHGQPQADGYIVGEVTIELARLMGACHPGHVMLALGHQARNIDRLARGVRAANQVLETCATTLGGELRARLAARRDPGGRLEPAVQSFRAKHGWVYRAVDLAIRMTGLGAGGPAAVGDPAA